MPDKSTIKVTSDPYRGWEARLLTKGPLEIILVIQNRFDAMKRLVPTN